VGLNLARVSFEDWVEESVPRKNRPAFFEALFKHVGKELDIASWLEVDPEEEVPSPKVGSYTSYGIFVYCLKYLAEGDYEAALDPDEDWELKALAAFRKSLDPASWELPATTHFTKTGASDAIFIPASFATPFDFDVVTVASKPAAMEVLQRLAETLGFELQSEYESEEANDEWLPISTVKNIARTIAKYFGEEPQACVEYT
jgi:hypothetical protein